MSLVFLDTETTGLDWVQHEVWEIAYAVEDGQIFSSVVPHVGATANPDSLTMNGYFNRVTEPPRISSIEHQLRRELEGNTVVASNPAFDTAFLKARWGVTPWHHRLWDVSAYATGVLGHDKPKGLAGITDELRARGYEIPTPDHSAAGDVAALRACFRALQAINRERAA